MRSVGISELKQNASRLVRTVQRTGEEVSVTVRGEVVALIIPAKKPRRRKQSAVWTDLDQLAREIGRHWKKGPGAVAAVREGRR
jgi:prevent-host-death family protein